MRVNYQKEQNKIALAIGLVAIMAAILFQITDFKVIGEITFKTSLWWVGITLAAYIFLMAIAYTEEENAKKARKLAEFCYWLGTFFVAFSIVITVIALIALRFVEEFGTWAYAAFICYLIYQKKKQIKKKLGLKEFWKKMGSMSNERINSMKREFKGLWNKKHLKITMIFVLALAIVPKVLGASFESYLATYFILLFTVFTVLFGIEWGLYATGVEGGDNKLGRFKTDHRRRRDLYFCLTILFLTLAVLSAAFDVDALIATTWSFLVGTA